MLLRVFCLAKKDSEPAGEGVFLRHRVNAPKNKPMFSDSCDNSRVPARGLRSANGLSYLAPPSPDTTRNYRANDTVGKTVADPRYQILEEFRRAVRNPKISRGCCEAAQLRLD